ncbi:MAG: hypothetical protein IMF12_02340, partial [Proteobacteria bacterium]|nr:hypothetical protein [Pseudomonadota bacterium]
MGKSILFRFFTIAAIGLLIIIYFSPIWWVSLKAPNYPPEAFPDGIRIHFHIDGVFNGCQKRESEEIQVGEGLNCLHEMDTINHYVGMYPIASGGIIERTLSQFLFSFLIVLLIAFMMSGRKLQVSALTLGFTFIVAWSYVTLFTPGGIKYMSAGYQQALQVSMDMEPDEFQNWSGMQAMEENYQDSLGMFFRDRTKIEAQTKTLIKATHIIIGILLFSMLFIIGGIILKNNLFYWLLLIIPLALPVFFILEYAGWLWWFGHNLNDMAAFTLK